MPFYGADGLEPHTEVHDVDARARLREVASVDTDTGEVVMFCWPLQVNAAGDDLVTATLRFRSIYPIFGGRPLPCLFHCYGRLDDITELSVV